MNNDIDLDRCLAYCLIFALSVGMVLYHWFW
jgi:hypothetical protein